MDLIEKYLNGSLDESGSSSLLDKVNTLNDLVSSLASEPKGTPRAKEIQNSIDIERAKFGFEATRIADSLYDRLMPTMDNLKSEIRDAKKSKSNSKVTRYGNKYVAQLADIQKHSDLVKKLAKEIKAPVPKGITPTAGMVKLVATAKATFNHWN